MNNKLLRKGEQIMFFINIFMFCVYIFFCVAYAIANLLERLVEWLPLPRAIGWREWLKNVVQFWLIAPGLFSCALFILKFWSYTNARRGFVAVCEGCWGALCFVWELLPYAFALTGIVIVSAYVLKFITLHQRSFLHKCEKAYQHLMRNVCL